MTHQIGLPQCTKPISNKKELSQLLKSLYNLNLQPQPN